MTPEVQDATDRLRTFLFERVYTNPVAKGEETKAKELVKTLFGWYTESGGYKWYQDVIPLTQLNIPNENLIDLTKGIDITYHIYF